MRKKIFNDPVYGFVSVPYGIILDLINHPYFQRLRRIRQTGLTHMVYPGALHTRFHHALGALHLMQQAIETLRSKNVEVTEAEAEGACIAILLHDIGHGPYSHALEHSLLPLHHEELSLLFMQQLDAIFLGKLAVALQIFKNEHPKKFLHQLVSGQLDMDRMDYLNRDSFFTGVSEGVIGYDRIIKMLDVHENELVVEEKGIYSVEKFLMARRLMYWQVYLHKTGIAAEQMLVRTLQWAKQLYRNGKLGEVTPNLQWFFEINAGKMPPPREIIDHFSKMDDADIDFSLKIWAEHPDPTLALLASGLLNRKLFKLKWCEKGEQSNLLEKMRPNLAFKYGQDVQMEYLAFEGMESNQPYKPDKEQIFIKFKDGRIVSIDKCADTMLYTQETTKHYICYAGID